MSKEGLLDHLRKYHRYMSYDGDEVSPQYLNEDFWDITGLYHEHDFNHSQCPDLYIKITHSHRWLNES